MSSVWCARHFIVFLLSSSRSADVYYLPSSSVLYPLWYYRPVNPPDVPLASPSRPLRLGLSPSETSVTSSSSLYHRLLPLPFIIISALHSPRHRRVTLSAACLPRSLFLSRGLWFLFFTFDVLVWPVFLQSSFTGLVMTFSVFLSVIWFIFCAYKYTCISFPLPFNLHENHLLYTVPPPHFPPLLLITWCPPATQLRHGNLLLLHHLSSLHTPFSLRSN